MNYSFQFFLVINQCIHKYEKKITIILLNSGRLQNCSQRLGPLSLVLFNVFQYRRHCSLPSQVSSQIQYTHVQCTVYKVQELQRTMKIQTLSLVLFNVFQYRRHCSLPSQVSSQIQYIHVQVLSQILYIYVQCTVYVYITRTRIP